ncbi:MAG: NDP-sugar synthase [bacterium]|nr:NDP-sugar synthase [bacterium]
MVKKAMIMAAGVGSRLDPLTQDVPKPLVPIANRPMMDILLERLKNIGVCDVVANTYYKAEQIIERYKNNSIGINFNYIQEETLSGTAGGVKKCQFFFEEGETFLVLSADGLSNVDFKAAIKAHEDSGAIASMGVKQISKDELSNFGVVVRDENGFVVEFQEKPSIEEAKSNCINTGIYIFNYEIFNYIPENQFYDFAKNVFPCLLENGIKINTFEVKEYWSDIGTIDQYAQSTFDLFGGKYNIAHTEIEKVADGLLLKGKSYVAPSSKIIGCNVIGDNSIIGKNVVLENCIIWDDVEVFDNVTLKNCIIASHSEIKIDMVNQIIGPNQVISKRKFS